MENNYYEVQITFNKKNYEELYNRLYLNGIENILEENGSLKIYFDEKDSGKINLIKEELISCKIIKEKDFISVKFENKNWNKEWENTIEPVYIKDKIIIYPSWKKDKLIDPEGKILIEIDPKMSFGTGHNETTQLVLELMSENIENSDEKMLDYGTGTGILTIAGIKLGISRGVAIDIDSDAIENAEEYFKRNLVQEKVKLVKANITEIEEDAFDVICANIIRSVITDNIEHISGKIKSNGKLFLSGILLSEDQEILEYLTQYYFEIQDIISSAEWIGIYAVKR